MEEVPASVEKIDGVNGKDHIEMFGNSNFRGWVSPFLDRDNEHKLAI